MNFFLWYKLIDGNAFPTVVTFLSQQFTQKAVFQAEKTCPVALLPVKKGRSCEERMQHSASVAS